MLKSLEVDVKEIEYNTKKKYDSMLQNEADTRQLKYDLQNREDELKKFRQPNIFKQNYESKK